MDEGESVYVNFETDISTTPYKRVVSSVEYTIPNTPDNIKDLKNTLLKKYGEKSFSNMANNPVWCQMDGSKCKPNT